MSQNFRFERKRGRRPPVVRVLVVVCAGATLGALTWIVVAAVGLYDDAATTSERAAALQAVAAGVSLTATLLLLCVTAWYALLTRGILRQSGPIVEADLRMGWLGIGSAITGPLALLAKGTPDERYSQPAFAIEVRNSGNAGVSIVRVAIESEAGFSLILTTAVAGTMPPFKLEGHSSETVCMDFNTLISGIAAWEEVMHTPSRKLRAVVGLGSGLTVHSPWETLP